ncbi:hypothetical protein CEXT_409391 [Caerostris extrusa]|uniref:Uncharacterized protein n=1 Tax=Caerostris extrusa TaxID=172846 RepID=A0AAV4RV20_CAEEX|nr:hypothetical protein CEXT_409391 [Caerostris extrusa]
MAIWTHPPVSPLPPGNGVERSAQNSISRKTTEMLTTLLFLRPPHKHAKHNGRVQAQLYTAGFRNRLRRRFPQERLRAALFLCGGTRESGGGRDHRRDISRELSSVSVYKKKSFTNGRQFKIASNRKIFNSFIRNYQYFYAMRYISLLNAI